MTSPSPQHLPTNLSGDLCRSASAVRCAGFRILTATASPTCRVVRGFPFDLGLDRVEVDCLSSFGIVGSIVPLRQRVECHDPLILTLSKGGVRGARVSSLAGRDSCRDGEPVEELETPLQ